MIPTSDNIFEPPPCFIYILYASALGRYIYISATCLSLNR